MAYFIQAEGYVFLLFKSIFSEFVQVLDANKDGKLELVGHCRSNIRIKGCSGSLIYFVSLLFELRMSRIVVEGRGNSLCKNVFCDHILDKTKYSYLKDVIEIVSVSVADLF